MTKYNKKEQISRLLNKYLKIYGRISLFLYIFAPVLKTKAY